MGHKIIASSRQLSDFPRLGARAFS